MGFVEDMKELLERAIAHAGNASALSKATGVSSPKLSQWKKGQSPHIRDFAPIVDYMSKANDERAGGIALIPRVKACAGAGSSLIVDDGVVEVLPFSRMLLTEFGCKEKNMVFLTVIGNSMAPLLADGDLILVDQGAREVLDGRIYVIGLGEELLVKRVLRSVNGILLHSQNPDFPDITVNSGEIESLRIVGRVVWHGHRL